jgi:enoyl-CoA hydratase
MDFRYPSEAVAGPALTAAGNALDRLACPSIAIVRAVPDPVYSRLAEKFDVLVADQRELDRVLRTIEQAPLASTALVQLLRLSAGRDVHEGLIAESLVYSMLQSGPEFACWLAQNSGSDGAEVSPDNVSVSATEGAAVLVERDGSALALTLNRPQRRNAFNTEMRDALVAGLSLAVSDDSVTEIVLRGAGPSFCAGGDLGEFGSFADPATAHAVRSTRNPGRLLDQCAERLRVEVHGACVGAGAELPAFAGRVSARKDAFFELPEVSMGLVPGAGGTVSIAGRIGRHKTAYLALSGLRVDAATALSWGLVDEIV